MRGISVVMELALHLVLIRASLLRKGPEQQTTPPTTSTATRPPVEPASPRARRSIPAYTAVEPVPGLVLRVQTFTPTLVPSAPAPHARRCLPLQWASTKPEFKSSIRSRRALASALLAAVIRAPSLRQAPLASPLSPALLVKLAPRPLLTPLRCRFLIPYSRLKAPQRSPPSALLPAREEEHRSQTSWAPTTHSSLTSPPEARR